MVVPLFYVYWPAIYILLYQVVLTALFVLAMASQNHSPYFSRRTSGRVIF